MEPIVIDEAILDTYQNFIEFQPTVDHLIEVICYEGGLPTNTFDIFRGMVYDDSTFAIVLTPPVTKVSVVDGIITYSGPAPLDDGIVMLLNSEHDNIYWKDHIPPMALPKRKQEAAEPIEKPTTPKKATQPVTESPVSVINHFGGKRTKRRKSLKKLKRKSTRVRIGKRHEHYP
jgi:hypothetical protein